MHIIPIYNNTSFQMMELKTENKIYLRIYLTKDTTKLDNLVIKVNKNSKKNKFDNFNF